MESDIFIKEKVIKYFGNQSKTAEFFDITRMSVSLWTDGEPIPKSRRQLLAALIPDHFSVEKQTSDS